MNVQTLADPASRLLWASAAVPGATNDIKAVRNQDIFHALTTARITAFADKGYAGVGRGVRVPFKPRHKNPGTGRYLPLLASQKTANAALARPRAPGERANAQLKSWRILQNLRSSPCNTTTIVKSILALTLST